MTVTALSHLLCRGPHSGCVRFDIFFVDSLFEHTHAGSNMPTWFHYVRHAGKRNSLRFYCSLECSKLSSICTSLSTMVALLICWSQNAVHGPHCSDWCSCCCHIKFALSATCLSCGRLIAAHVLCSAVYGKCMLTLVHFATGKLQALLPVKKFGDLALVGCCLQ